MIRGLKSTREQPTKNKDSQPNKKKALDAEILITILATDKTPKKTLLALVDTGTSPSLIKCE